jgi:membrane associated rhomboid family serine protease
MSVCYRHPNRETGVSCSSCGRPICPDCMTPTPVGMRCPECARERTKVKRMPNRPSAPVVTQILIAINVLAFLGEVATGTGIGGVSVGHVGTLYTKGVLYGPFITQLHQYYRLVTAGFLHDGILHIAFNMWFLFIMGPMLESAIGRVNYIAVYAASLLTGSFGALLLSPDLPSLGASGALFGVLGALMVVSHYRRISIWQNGLALTLIINIVFSLTIADVSIGAHIGGFVGGAICGWLIMELGERRNLAAIALAGCGVVAAVGVVAAIAVAGSHGLAPNGITI